MRTLFISFSLALAVSPLAAQQRAADIPTRSRVRVVLPDSVRQSWFTPRQQWIHGELAAMGPDTLYLKVPGAAESVAIPHKNIRRIDRSLGVPSRPASAIQGAFGAAILGAVYGVALRSANADDWRGRSVGESAALGAGFGAAAGFVLGAVFPTERWRRVRLW